MQILGKRSKVLLIAVAVVMLVAVGVSFAMWDMSAVKATSGNLSNYANAKIGDVITFGQYYQSGIRVNGEYEKTPIEWLVVDKDERTGQLTLMSKYILAAGSYFGNGYYNEEAIFGMHYQNDSPEIGGISYNQAYVESTVRAFLNNLERRDLGGDSYSISDGYKTSVFSSDVGGKLLTSVGYSNKMYSFTDDYRRPTTKIEFKNRPATRGFYDEAFTDEEKAMIMPKAIAGYTGFRWPNNDNNLSKMLYVEGAVDKIWLPSITELNIMSVVNDHLTNPSDEASSTVFEYFGNHSRYKNLFTGTINSSLAEALKTIRTPFVANSAIAMNYSIPIYKYQSTSINDNIHDIYNSNDFYWSRSPRSNVAMGVRIVHESGTFGTANTYDSYIGVRPCMILKY